MPERVRIRCCPCGARLERKANESQQQFEQRRHCNAQHRGKYHPYPAAKQGFGLTVPADKSRKRTDPGLHAWITSRTV